MESSQCVVALAGADQIHVVGSNGAVFGGPGDDSISGASHVVPGPGRDNVSATVGDDTIEIWDLCEVQGGEVFDFSAGFDTLVAPFPVETLRAHNVVISNEENVVLRQNSCRSECVQKPDCSNHGDCAEGAQPGLVRCECHRGWRGDHCETPVPIPSVECVTRFTDDKWSAKFTYENLSGSEIVVSEGAENHFSPPIPAGQGPGAKFAPGKHAFWVPFAGGELTWTIQGASVTASSASSPRCTQDNYPTVPSDVPPEIVDPDRPISLRSNALKLDLPDRPPYRAPESLPVAKPPAQTNPETFPVSRAKLNVTRLRFGDNDGSPSMRADIRVNGNKVRSVMLGCSDDPTDGCIPPPIGQWIDIEPVELVNETTATTADIEVVIYDLDYHNGPDEMHRVAFTFDTATGEWSGGTNFPDDCSTSSGWGVCWEGIGSVEPPPALSGLLPPRICASFHADFVDEGAGEDIIARPLSSVFGSEYPASFALATLGLSSVNHGTIVWSGVLDEDGCVPRNELFAKGVSMRFFAVPEELTAGDWWVRLDVTSTFVRNGIIDVFSVAPGSKSSDKVFDINKKTKTLTTFAATRELSRGELRQWAPTGDGWKLPGGAVYLSDGRLDDVGRASAVIARILATPDNGVPSARFEVYADDGCPNESLATDSCASRRPMLETPDTNDSMPVLFIGPATAGLPSQSHWKYIVAHEMGHLIQGQSMGFPIGAIDGYDCGAGNQCPDPPSTPDLCACNHVDAANGLHCMQSLETSGGAQREGFAQFYAAKVWNAPDEGECVHHYYKEFLDSKCLHGDAADCKQVGALVVAAPPVKLTCKKPVRWRNNHCAVPTLGTEFDWMGFLWNATTSGEGKITMSELGSIYRAVPRNIDTSWAEIENATKALFPSPTSKQREHVGRTADIYGVSVKVDP